MTMHDIMLDDIEGMRRHEGALGFGAGRYKGMAVVLNGPARGNQPKWAKNETAVALSEADFASMDDVTLFRVYRRILRRFYTQM